MESSTCRAYVEPRSLGFFQTTLINVCVSYVIHRLQEDGDGSLFVDYEASPSQNLDSTSYWFCVLLMVFNRWQRTVLHGSCILSKRICFSVPWKVRIDWCRSSKKELWLVVFACDNCSYVDDPTCGTFIELHRRGENTNHIISDVRVPQGIHSGYNNIREGISLKYVELCDYWAQRSCYLTMRWSYFAQPAWTCQQRYSVNGSTTVDYVDQLAGGQVSRFVAVAPWSPKVTFRVAAKRVV